MLVLQVLPSVTRAYGLSLYCRKRENSLQEDRGSFVTTPTAELSNQEETLLGSLLDWSLDCCSGYEGDQESEGEKEGDGGCHSLVLGKGCGMRVTCDLRAIWHCAEERSEHSGQGFYPT